MKSLLSASLLSMAFCVANAYAQESVQQASPLAVDARPSEQMPNLDIRWDCQSCEENPKVAPLIAEGYAKEVKSQNRSIANDEVAEVHIIDFRQRNPATRVLFGIMAGKDRLGVRIVYRGQTLSASDYSANALEGMNYLCESVARKSFQAILTASRSSVSVNPLGSSDTGQVAAGDAAH